ncbi:hypothetical protein [Streptomyces sp. NPDC086010]|uniref:hypothetical protein n=1 Tax=Streptomyces sp. NPDC086010 TaxID=3365745 RepID=UPI0037D1A121
MVLSSPQPRRTPPLDLAELLAAYTWPQHQGERLVSFGNGNYSDDAPHTALTIGEFLDQHRHLPVVRLLQASDSAYTFLVELARPSWELAGGDAQ